MYVTKRYLFCLKAAKEEIVDDYETIGRGRYELVKQIQRIYPALNPAHLFAILLDPNALVLVPNVCEPKRFEFRPFTGMDQQAWPGIHCLSDGTGPFIRDEESGAVALLGRDDGAPATSVAFSYRDDDGYAAEMTRSWPPDVHPHVLREELEMCLFPGIRPHELAFLGFRLEVF